MKKKFKVVFFGDNTWAHNTLKKLVKDKSIEILIVFSRIKKDQVLEKISKQNFIPFRITRNINSIKNINNLANLKPDLLVSMSYDQIFKKKILKLFKNKIINCHAGLLPSYRGRNVLNWVLINGEKNFGITVHKVSKLIDQGQIFDQKIFKIKHSDDYFTILKKSYVECSKILYKTIKKIQNKKAKSIPQKISKIKPSYFRKRRAGDENLNLNQKSIKIYNFVRALVPPGPSAKIFTKNNEIRVNKVRISNYKNNIFNLKTICFVNKRSFCFNTIDKKLIYVKQWSSKKKFVPKAGIKFL